MKTITTAQLNKGDSFTMEVTDIKEGKYGPVYVAKVDGEACEVRPSGNLKFFANDLARGTRKLNTPYKITRVSDMEGTTKDGRKYLASQFEILQVKNQTAEQEEVKAKLDAIRAKKTAAK